jgi:hypothetical protein
LLGPESLRLSRRLRADRHSQEPLAGTERGSRLRALLIVSAEDESGIRRRLAEDPWARSDRLRIARVEPWNLFVGAERLPS